MRALVVYESMFGNTKAVAHAIAKGLETWAVVDVVEVNSAPTVLGEDVSLLVVGGPTHAWSMSRPNTRRAAAKQAGESGGKLSLEPGGAGAGLREWLGGLPAGERRVAVFDTRIQGPRFVTGRASASIVRTLRGTGATLVAPSQSFLVTKRSELVDGERERARRWGAELAARLSLACRPR